MGGRKASSRGQHETRFSETLLTGESYERENENERHGLFELSVRVVALAERKPSYCSIP